MSGAEGAIVAGSEEATSALPAHPRHGSPSSVWTYRNAEGLALVRICRFDREVNETTGKPDKVILPLSLVFTPNGKTEWRWKNIEAPRPLYNLPQLHASSESDIEVVITEGEKAADAAGLLFPNAIATTSMNGANAVNQSDWSVLRGRRCLVAPDLDNAGEKYLHKVVAALQEAGASEIRVLDLSGIACRYWRDGYKYLRRAEDIEKGYDLADAQMLGWSPERLADELKANPHFIRCVFAQVENPATVTAPPQIFESDSGTKFEVREDGVWKLEDVYDKKQKEWIETETRVCSQLRVVGSTRNREGADWGRVVEFADPDGNMKRVIIPAQHLGAPDGIVIRRLMSEGLIFVNTPRNREMLTEYLCSHVTDVRFTHVTKPGWVGDSFALPGATFGPGHVICDLGDIDHRYHVSGTLEDWRKFSSLAVGNSRLAFAMSAAFAGPLLDPLRMESGGFNFMGDMGSGKSTIVEAAGSVWGGGKGQAGYVRGWQGSEAAHEGVAVTTNETLLALDEIGQADPVSFGGIVYMLGNGGGKNRSDTSGKLKATNTFRTMLLSSGEKSVEEVLADGPRQKNAMAGHLVRLIDIPVDTGTGQGAFEVLHGFPNSRSFAIHLRRQSSGNFGYAARDFLEKLVANISEAVEVIETTIEDFIKDVCSPGASPQVLRAASKFALVAAAGELAASYGVLPWPAGEAIWAAKRCFQAWLAVRGTSEYTREYLEAIKLVQRFISLHGQSRFGRIKGTGDPADERFGEQFVANRAGFMSLHTDGMHYFVLPQVWRTDVCQGHDPEKVAQVLKQAGLLVGGEKGRTQKKVRVPGHESSIRCYVLKPSILSWSENSNNDSAEDEDM